MKSHHPSYRLCAGGALILLLLMSALEVKGQTSKHPDSKDRSPKDTANVLYSHTQKSVNEFLTNWLMFWNHWSIACHFALALIGVAAVRDADAVVENRMLELKASTARQDIITARKTSAIGNPLVLIFAKLRGFVDAISLAVRLL